MYYGDMLSCLLKNTILIWARFLERARALKQRALNPIYCRDLLYYLHYIHFGGMLVGIVKSARPGHNCA